MGYIIFTKQYSSSDNGSTINGSDIGTIQTDISAILNGGITNVNISASAAITESKLAFDTSSGHNHDGSNSRVISSGAFRGFIQGAELEYVAADQIKAKSGVLDIAGSLYTRTSYSTTIDTDTATHWVEGSSQRATLQAAGGGWAYVYAYNDSGITWDIKYWLQPPQYANTGTDDSSVKIFRQNASVWYRCLGAVRVDNVGSGNIIPTIQTKNIFYYKTRVTFNSPAGDGTYNDVDLTTYVPNFGEIIAGINIDGGTHDSYLITKGVTSQFFFGNTGDGLYIYGIAEVLTDTNQFIEHNTQAGETDRLCVVYYKVPIR